MAANTTRIRLLSHVVVLSYHHPLEIVKRWGTLDVASGGRVILGVGVGSLKQEFDTLGHTFEGRGASGDDSIRAIRASWGVRVPAYKGTHFDFGDLIVEPSGMDRPLEIWVGGRTRRSLRRAIELGDAWIPFKLKRDELEAMLADPEIRDLMAGRASPLDLIFPPEPPVDPRVSPRRRAPSSGPTSTPAPPGSACASPTSRATTTSSSSAPSRSWSPPCREPCRPDTLRARCRPPGPATPPLPRSRRRARRRRRRRRHWRPPSSRRCPGPRRSPPPGRVRAVPPMDPKNGGVEGEHPAVGWPPPSSPPLHGSSAMPTTGALSRVPPHRAHERGVEGEHPAVARHLPVATGGGVRGDADDGRVSRWPPIDP